MKRIIIQKGLFRVIPQCVFLTLDELSVNSYKRGNNSLIMCCFCKKVPLRQQALICTSTRMFNFKDTNKVFMKVFQQVYDYARDEDMNFTSSTPDPSYDDLSFFEAIEKEDEFFQYCEEFDRNDTDTPITMEKLKNFLKRTEECGGSKEERLRQLAIHLEGSIVAGGWDDIHMIYATAALSATKDPLVFLSWGISATERCQNWWEKDPVQQLSIARTGEATLKKAFELDSHNPEVTYALGNLYYNYPEVDPGLMAELESNPDVPELSQELQALCAKEDAENNLQRALEWFESTIDLDPKHVMGHLYLAHCYQDLGKWVDAIETYEQIDVDLLLEQAPSWRYFKRHEQMAYCYAKANKIEMAFTLFQELIDEIDSWEKEAVEEHIVDLDELVDVATHSMRDLLFEQTRTLLFRIGFAEQYPEMFIQQETELPD